MAIKLKTSVKWLLEIPSEYNLIILDPDGWNRSNYDYSFKKEKISKEEFIKRLSYSTIQCKSNLWEYLIKWKVR